MVDGLKSMQQVLADQFTVDVVDIDLHPALDATWGEMVPVLLDGDTEICHHFLDINRVRQYLSLGQ